MAGPGRLGTLSVPIKVARLCAVMIMSGERNGSGMVSLRMVSRAISRRLSHGYTLSLKELAAPPLKLSVSSLPI